MSALPQFVPDPLALHADADGVIRVGGTRVPLDLLVEAFDEGATPEEIVHRYSVVSLADVYAILGYVLSHREEVEAYLADRRIMEVRVRTENERRSDPKGIRERLLARNARG